MSSGVNMLTNSLKISDTTKTKIFQLTFLQSHRKMWQKYCDSAPLTSWLFISVLIRDFFWHLSKLAFCSLEFQKQITSKAHLFLKSIPNFMQIPQNAQKNWANIFWFGNMCIWIGCVKHSLLLRENPCHRVSLC